MDFMILYVFANLASTYSVYRLMRVCLGNVSAKRSLCCLTYLAYYSGDIIFFYLLKMKAGLF